MKLKGKRKFKKMKKANNSFGSFVESLIYVNILYFAIQGTKYFYTFVTD
jgi:hypothetical protein